MQNLRIFVASSGDTQTERLQTDEIIQKLNQSPEYKNAFKLECVRYDSDFYSTPMSGRAAPQDSISKYTARPDECDLVVGILKHRLGTKNEIYGKNPKGEWMTGTEWEIRQALKSEAKSEIFIYHCKKRPNFNIMEMEHLEKAANNLKQVKDFIAEIQKKGSTNSYEDEQFSEKLEGDLRQWLKRQPKPPSPNLDNQKDAFDKIPIHNPLIIAPEKNKNLQATLHYSQVQEQLRHLLPRGCRAIPRVKHRRQLEAYFLDNDIDFIYIYAVYKKGHILLDRKEETPQSISLEELANKLISLPEHCPKPIIIINFITKLKLENIDLPLALVKSTRLLILHVGRLVTRDLVIDWLEKLTTKQPCLESIIQKHLEGHLNTNICIKNSGKLVCFIFPEQDSQQFIKARIRAVLIRILLGRNEDKQRFAGILQRDQRPFSQRTLMSYVAVGHEHACPHEFPSQIQEHLESSTDNYLPVVTRYIKFDFYARIEDDDMEAELNMQLNQSMGHQSLLHAVQNLARSSDPYRKCLALAWLVKVKKEVDQNCLKKWIEEWAECFLQPLVNVVPKNRVLLGSLNISLEDSSLLPPQTVQTLAEDILEQQSWDYNWQHISREEPLGHVKKHDILSFYKLPEWKTFLFKEFTEIKPYYLADWIMRETKGRFSDTVDFIWKSYKSGYSDFKQSSYNK